MREVESERAVRLSEWEGKHYLISLPHTDLMPWDLPYSLQSPQEKHNYIENQPYTILILLSID